jgi:GNAT superfamily N-acetyltransferase
MSPFRGRVLFVDDLVTSPSARSRGVASTMLRELRTRAAATGCRRLELDSGTTNSGGHRFYLRHGLDISAFHFGCDVEQAGAADQR